MMIFSFSFRSFICVLRVRFSIIYNRGAECAIVYLYTTVSKQLSIAILQCARWLSPPHSPTLPPPVTVKHWVVKFQEISLSRDRWLWRERLLLRKEGFLRRGWKMPGEMWTINRSRIRAWQICLSQLIPPRRNPCYDLRPRHHDRLLTQKPNSTVDSDFIIRMLFKDSY